MIVVTKLPGCTAGLMFGEVPYPTAPARFKTLGVNPDSFVSCELINDDEFPGMVLDVVCVFIVGVGFEVLTCEKFCLSSTACSLALISASKEF